jgi:hypothetical protein
MRLRAIPTNQAGTGPASGLKFDRLFQAEMKVF